MHEDVTKDAKKVEALVKAVMPLFRGRSVQLQGAALADLLSIWLAGHVVPGIPAPPAHGQGATVPAIGTIGLCPRFREAEIGRFSPCRGGSGKGL